MPSRRVSAASSRTSSSSNSSSSSSAYDSFNSDRDNTRDSISFSDYQSFCKGIKQKGKAFIYNHAKLIIEKLCSALGLPVSELTKVKFDFNKKFLEKHLKVSCKLTKKVLLTLHKLFFQALVTVAYCYCRCFNRMSSSNLLKQSLRFMLTHDVVDIDDIFRLKYRQVFCEDSRVLFIMFRTVRHRVFYYLEGKDGKTELDRVYKILDSPKYFTLLKYWQFSTIRKLQKLTLTKLNKVGIYDDTILDRIMITKADLAQENSTTFFESSEQFVAVPLNKVEEVLEEKQLLRYKHNLKDISSLRRAAKLNQKDLEALGISMFQDRLKLVKAFQKEYRRETKRRLKLQQKLGI